MAAGGRLRRMLPAPLLLLLLSTLPATEGAECDVLGFRAAQELVCRAAGIRDLLDLPDAVNVTRM